MDISYTPRFKKQLKKYKHNPKVLKRFTEIIHYRESNAIIPSKFRDHKLSGNLKQYRELHLFPDILLVYELDTAESLITLAMIGSHSEIFG